MGKKKSIAPVRTAATAIDFGVKFKIEFSDNFLVEDTARKYKVIVQQRTPDICKDIINDLITKKVLCGHLAGRFNMFDPRNADAFDDFLLEKKFKVKFDDFMQNVFQQKRDALKQQKNVIGLDGSLIVADDVWSVIKDSDDDEPEQHKEFFGPPDLRRKATFCEDVNDTNSDQKKIKMQFKSILQNDLYFADCRHIDRVRKQLVQEFPYAVAVIDTLLQGTLENHSVGKQGILIRPTLIHGRPGLGKTRLAKRVCELLGVFSRTVSVAGKHDNLLFGVSKGWGTATPSMMVEVIHEAKVMNPVIILDEIEKVAEERRNGNLHETLLPLLEKHEAERWVDPCLTAPCDMSHIGWIFTANEIDTLPQPFRSRVKAVEIDVPKAEHVPVLLSRIRLDIAKSRGLDHRFIRDFDEAERNSMLLTFEQHKSIRILIEQVRCILELRDKVYH